MTKIDKFCRDYKALAKDGSSYSWVTLTKYS